MAVAIRRGEKKYFERVEHVEGVRYEIVLTGHAVYLDRQVSVMSQWVGGIILGLILHIIGVIVQFGLLRTAHYSGRIPYTNLQTTAVRRVPRTMILLLGLALTIVIPILVIVVGELLSFMTRLYLPFFPILAGIAFVLGCLMTIIMLIRYPRTVLGLGCNAREYEFHSLGEEALVREIIERLIALQDRFLAAQGQGEMGSVTKANAAAPIPGPQRR